MYVKYQALAVREQQFRQITLSKIFQIQNSPVSQFIYGMFHIMLNSIFSNSKFKRHLECIELFDFNHEKFLISSCDNG